MARTHVLPRLAVRRMHLQQHVVSRRTVSVAASDASRPMKVLGIETSADDTCVALMSLRNVPGRGDIGRVIGSDRITYANKKHKGIHPVEAVVSHTQHLSRMVTEVITNNKPKSPGPIKPDLICVTRGPGMGGCLSIGVSTAKALSAVWDVPVVGVHHMQAHALTPSMERTIFTSRGELPYPFLTLLVSGKHTMLVHTKSLVNHRILCKSSNIALGEVLDKVARELIPISIIENQPDEEPICFPRIMEDMADNLTQDYLAAQSRQDEIKVYKSQYGWELQPPLRNTVKMKYDFNGLFSTTLTIVRAQPEMSPREREELASHFMRLAFEHLMSRVIIALKTDGDLLRDPPKTLVLSGGVASNNLLRKVIQKTLEARGFKDIMLNVPGPKYCTDNAQMIAYTGWKMYSDGWETDRSFCPVSNWSIEDILSGVDCWTRRPGFQHITPEDAQSERQGRDLANNEADSTITPEKSQDPVPSLPERKDSFPGETLFSPNNPHSSHSETKHEETFDLPSENPKKAKLPSKASKETAFDKTSEVSGEDTEEENIKLEKLLLQAESILDKLGLGSHATATSEKSPPTLKVQKTAQSKSPNQEAGKPPPADQNKHIRREGPSPRGQGADDRIDANASDKNCTAQEYQPDQEVSAAVKLRLARRRRSLSTRDRARTKPKRDSLRATREKAAANKSMKRPAVVSARKPTTVPTAPEKQPSSRVRVAKLWPPMPSPKERHDLKIRFLGFADDPAPPAQKSPPTFMSKIASTFGFGPKK
ncbi:hypothetical protein N0V93_003829 [Gnomoniopsis smithogilvyi]|uniref:N(6)-L-threonylcarbamoyladenine synthase n=1 Tax=Gnomoniopsis smithogilvyi TaxID=1191159 RepID=A0A9W8Z1J0_9PEZI|nr:hypothetical protein N0V93_003829 [Gnomoniopsis smithogilvyi]